MTDAARTCLLVEDDFVLRLHTADRLREMGVGQVVAVEGEDDALDYLARARPGFAIVDYRLGRMETAERVAAALLDLAVPFVIATGLGELPDGNDRFEGAPVLSKPLSGDALRQMLVAAGLLAND